MTRSTDVNRMMIEQWLAEMREAAVHDDAATIARLARRVVDRIELEQQRRGEQWQREQEWRWEYGVDDDDDDAPDVHPVRRGDDST